MANLKVVVPFLNKRTSPVENAAFKNNIAGQVKMDSQFEGEAAITNSLGTWYQDREGYYYWGGGIEVLSNEKISFDSEKMSWAHKLYDIPFIWNDLNTKGKDITVAIVDTGIDKSHIDLVDNFHSGSKSFIGNEHEFSDNDGHGTAMAGIVAATGKHKVYGIAPEAKLLIVKAAQQERGANVKIFANAINYASEIAEVDIISISNCFFINDPDLQNAINKCIAADKIVVAAIGNGRDFIGKPNGPDDDTFPACYNNVIAIGAFDQQGQVCNFSNWNSHLSLLSPGDFSILTTGINNTAKMGTGTSIATALTAGSLALLLSYAKRKSISPISCIEAIMSTCDDIGSFIGKDIQSGNGRLNLRNAISKLKKI